MLLNVTEEQKKIIESQGYMVVEFKKFAIHSIELFKNTGFGNIDSTRLVLSFLEYIAFEKICSVSLEKYGIFLKETFEECYKMLETFKDIVLVVQKQKYGFVRSIGKKYEPMYRSKVIYHRCRDRC